MFADGIEAWRCSPRTPFRDNECGRVMIADYVNLGFANTRKVLRRETRPDSG